jgi:hypothetical protein
MATSAQVDIYCEGTRKHGPHPRRVCQIIPGFGQPKDEDFQAAWVAALSTTTLLHGDDVVTEEQLAAREEEHARTRGQGTVPDPRSRARWRIPCPLCPNNVTMNATPERIQILQTLLDNGVYEISLSALSARLRRS